MIVNGRLKERKRELERYKKPKPDLYGANPLYILGLEHDVCYSGATYAGIQNRGMISLLLRFFILDSLLLFLYLP